ncbi:MAG: NADH-ubiquinone oxidoreductase-F iron-sulfur binding region domain-containing protein [Pseudomonadota bacterium]
MKRLENNKALEALRAELQKRRDPKKTVVTVCGGTGCHGYGCEKVIEAFRSELFNKGLSERVELRVSGCHGFCERGPLALIQPKGIFYQRIEPTDVPEIIAKTILGDDIVEKLLYELPDGKRAKLEKNVPFYARQQRLIFSANQRINADSIEDYIADGGYAALPKALGMKPEAIVDEVKKAGLRGRGGGGFPTGRKWETVRKAQPGQLRYVICNADEGDPGAYMDRSLLEGNPNSVLEGMIIGAYAIGSNEGYIYVRNEYPLAVKNVRIALKQAKELGLIGKDILGSGFDFDITISRGGGAFVCGESTALMASLEGRIGEPRAKYIHTAEYGLHDKPSCLNNVETWANVPLIINKGADWYASIGTAGSKGTKIFSLVGKINNTGLVEVPMGIKLREIIYDIGGGIPNGKKFKAVQTGGPSGGCIPESLLDLSIDFDELTKAGSMMGSGGLIVMDEDTCVVDIARYFTKFLTEESCGKCVPCREGVAHMLWILERICNGEGREDDIKLLEEMSETIIDGSLCALGSTAPNPVLSTIRYFRDEYEAHIKDKRCPARVCKALITYNVIDKNCTGCTSCARACPTEAAVATDKPAPAPIKGKVNPKLKLHTVVQDKCIKCGMCYEACKYGAIKVE